MIRDEIIAPQLPSFMILNNVLFSLYLSFLICKIGIITVPASDITIQLNKMIHAKTLKWCPTKDKVFNKLVTIITQKLSWVVAIVRRVEVELAHTGLG